MAKIFVTREKRQAKYYLEDLGNDIQLQMVLIPSGSFEMGADENELESLDEERPKHSVRIETFFLGSYAITQAQWRVVAAWDAIEQDLKPEPSNFKGDDLPVESVTWYEAVEFCARLSKRTGRNYRLPSEAEWEYACRAGTTTPFHFGETITTDLANYDGDDTYGKGPKGEYREKTTPVGYFKRAANPFGLYDMHGNVWEWCEDDYHKNYQGAPQDGRAWIDKSDSKTSKVLRGGSWVDFPRYCRSAYRYWNDADDRYYRLGFRVCCSAPRTE